MIHAREIMEKQDVLSALAALAQETRLDVFRRLVQAGSKGMPAGELAGELAISPANLSFHLKELRNARLLTSEREGRSIRYAPDFSVIGALVGYLGENCCRDETCGGEMDLIPTAGSQDDSSLSRDAAPNSPRAT
jgi:ArsR family transcriptional regulator